MGLVRGMGLFARVMLHRIKARGGARTAALEREAAGRAPAALEPPGGLARQRLAPPSNLNFQKAEERIKN